jgi:hypothetical protein
MHGEKLSRNRTSLIRPDASRENLLGFVEDKQAPARKPAKKLRTILHHFIKIKPAVLEIAARCKTDFVLM